MYKKARKRYYILKLTAAILFLLSIILFFTSRYLSAKFKPLIKVQLKELVLNATDSLYRIEFSDVSTNFITRGAALSDVRIIPDTIIFKKLIALKKAPNNIYYITLKRLTIKDFHPQRLLKHKKLNIDVLLFDHPDVTMINRQFEFNEVKNSFPEKTPYDYISDYLKELRIRTVDFKNMRFKYVNQNLPVPKIDSVNNLNITLKDWLIDPHSAQDQSRIYLLKDISINLNNYTFASPDSLYHINLNQLNFKASSGKLNINSFSVVPRYDEMAFGQVSGFSKKRLNIQMSDISMSGINLPLYILKQELEAKEMNIANGFVSIFNNNALPLKKEDRFELFPHQLMQTMTSKFSVKRLNVKDVDISYAEFDRDSRQRGVITFNRTSGTISNVTNREKDKTKHPYMLADLTSYMMGRGKLDVNFRFDLQAKDGAFTYSGVLGPMEGRVLNRITKPLGMVEVRSGAVKKLEFKIEANNHIANGDLRFAFNDLSLGLLKKHEEENRLVKQGWMSFIANAMIINSDNPNNAGIFIHAPIHYEREPKGSLFSFIWKTLFTGIKASVGVTTEKEEKIRGQIAKFEQIKIDRDKRRAERQRRKVRREKERGD
ncbi:hypothetical protein [Pedobacter metabolipauper]|uniref:AsmA-like protein n=1 Tax=Pedobacter metabolipauper TaxID=425513 RepID=A0A4R6SV45_9SPHI|nr:hypothetical protein [Pedobacter metabolipauper]TDQ09241.1 hypothetical protein ATK78_1395 [Pedobacter metabolipauper]